MGPRSEASPDSAFGESSISSEGGSPAASTPSIRRLLLKDKMQYLTHVVRSIENAKKEFLVNFVDVSAGIEETTLRLLGELQTRERQLKAQLEDVRRAKLSRWNRQLSICEKASSRLRSVAGGGVALDFADEYLLGEVEFVDSGALKFEAGDLSSPSELCRISSPGRRAGGIGAESEVARAIAIAPKLTFGSGGEGPGEFCRPWGIACDLTGRILVSDRSNHRVQIFSESGEFLLEFGREGAGVGEFNRPAGIVVDRNGRIVVADKDNHRVQVFSYSGRFLFEFGREGCLPGEFSYPWDVASNSRCDIAVSDTKNARVQLFDESGRFIAAFDKRRATFLPRGLDFLPNGSLLVTDFDRHRVLVIDERFQSMAVFGREGSDPGQFFRPQGISSDPSSGRIAVADCKNYRVQVFDAEFRPVAFFGRKGVAPGEFDCPHGISFHRNGSIVVVDFNNNRIQVF